MKCPHCSVTIYLELFCNQIRSVKKHSKYAVQAGVCPDCDQEVLMLYTAMTQDSGLKFVRTFMPDGVRRGPVPTEVPSKIASDYMEACNTISVSPKASAALSRRCLQAILNEKGYTGKDLAKQIDALLAETDASKAIGSDLRMTIDGVRNFGNFSAHPITDQTSLQIIDVEPEEAEWCLEILESCFDHFYVRPERARQRKAALDAKLHGAGKPLSK